MQTTVVEFPENHAKIFETFLTTKPIGIGTGLGLSVTPQIIVEKHGAILNLRI
ncbi:MAG: hypothetical protein KME22_21415 [Hassallia sp. WJT32-NPBG1]|nr:hypothetical protein [Hassallia sp. WJT32-NPBG1]